MEAAVEVEVYEEEVELTEEELEARRETCYQLEVSIKDAIGRGREAMWQLAKSLYEFNEEHGWTALGYESQGEWLAQPEIGMSKRNYHRMVRLWNHTVVLRSIPEEDVIEIEPSKMEIVLPSIESNKKTVVEALEDARSLGVRDLREVYIGPQGTPTHPHDEEEDATGADAAGKKKDSGPAYFHAAQVFDSWVTTGGDKRKALRNWTKFLDTHPIFKSVHLIEAFANGETLDAGEGAEPPTREQVTKAWSEIVKSLHMKLPTE